MFDRNSRSWLGITMGIVFLNSGVLTTVQDMGRTGYQRFGFHVSGAMDKIAYEIGNTLIDNNNEEAAIEFAIMGPMIKFTADTVIAITGGDYRPQLNNSDIPMYKAIAVKKDDVLKFGFAKEGVWGYLCIAGGIDVPVVMGSRSTDIKSELGGYQGRKLMNGDELALVKNVPDLPNMDAREYERPSFKESVKTVRVVLGPQDDYFTESGIETFLSAEYEVTNECDRMGYRVVSDSPIEHNEKGADIISDGIAYGSIQVPSQGQPIVLLSDRQTTGGYTKIATVIGHDIPGFVQRRPGEKIRFEAVSPEEAQKLALEQFEQIEALRNKINPKLSRTGLAGFIRRLFER